MLKLLPARSLDQGLDYVNSIVETNMASRMPTGTVRSYQQSLTLHMMPVNLIGVAISTAFFPNLTESIAHGRKDLFKRDLQNALRMIVFLALPISVMFYFFRGYLVNFIKNGGDNLIADLLGILVISIFCRTIYHIAARSFYAMQDTKTPLRVSILAIGLNIVLAIWFSMGLNSGPYGLAWAQSIGALVEIMILGVLMRRKIDGLFDAKFISAMVKVALASVATGIISYVLVGIFPLMEADESFFVTFPKFVLIGTISTTVYLVVAKALKVEEVDPILDRIKKFLFSQSKVRK